YAALEAYTGHLLLCAAIGWYFIKPSKWLGPLSIIALTYWLVCSGHPQMMYYGILGAAFFMLASPFFLPTMLPETKVDFAGLLRFWLKTGIYLVLGIILSSAYIIPFYFDFIATNAGRIEQSYAWADGYRDTFIGTLNSFFLPFRSDVHGSFGGSFLFVLAMAFPALKLFRVKIPKSVWAVWILLIIFFLYMQGGRTPVHRLAWEYLPFASSFRIAGRISLIIPVFIMMLLAWLTGAEPFTLRMRGRSVNLTLLKALSLSALILTVIYFILFTISFLFPFSTMREFAHFTPVAIRGIHKSIEILSILLGIVSLIMLILYSFFPEKSRFLGIILCITIFVHVGCIIKYGTWTAKRHDKPTFDQMLSQKKDKLDYPYHPGNGLYSEVVETQIKQSFIEPFLGKIYFDIIPVLGQEEAYYMMQQNLLPQHIFVEDYSPAHWSSIDTNSMITGKGSVELVYSSFNLLRFKVSSNAPAFFGLSYPYTGHWNAWVNDTNVKIYRANGAAHAVEIPVGESLIEFRYWSPAAFQGMLISCITFILIGLYYCIRSINGPVRILSLLVVLATGTTVFFLWHDSLYKGDNLETGYSWEYTGPPRIPNLAYGKKTLASSSFEGGFLLPNYSSRAIDGNINPESGFSTAAEDDPFLVIDLYKNENIHSILLYESTLEKTVNIRPLKLAFSMDGQQWQTTASVTSDKSNDRPIHVVLKRSLSARFIRIQASGYCTLKLDEVEVYSTKEML
ncbi:MAG: discoidin domain-containing protein, partial [Thermodesulfovibrionia bacterium]|nr:discoidin domain-containing protein [Thermodesulfovibrionia bacterium]